MFHPLGFFPGSAAALPAAPTIGAGTMLGNSSGGSTTTFASAYTSSTGKVLVRASGRIQASGLTSITFTVGGAAITVRAVQYGPTSQAAGDMWVWIGTATGITTGSALSVVCTGDKTLNRHVIMLNDISAGWGGAVGASNTTAVTSAAQDVSSVSVSATATQSSRLWVGMGSFMYDGMTPMTANSTWSKNGETTTGSGVGTSNASSFWSITGPSSGTQLLAVTGTGNAFVSGAAILELQ